MKPPLETGRLCDWVWFWSTIARNLSGERHLYGHGVHLFCESILLPIQSFAFRHTFRSAIKIIRNDRQSLNSQCPFCVYIKISTPPFYYHWYGIVYRMHSSSYLSDTVCVFVWWLHHRALRRHLILWCDNRMLAMQRNNRP